MTAAVLLLAQLLATAQPVLSIDAVALHDEAVTEDRKARGDIAGGVGVRIASPPVRLLDATHGFVSDVEPDVEPRIAAELDRATRAVKAALAGR